MYFSSKQKLQIGNYNILEVVSDKEHGFYLDGMNYDTILLPRRYIPKNKRIGDKIKVFIYKDSEDRLIATTERPFAVVDEFAFLRVASANRIGAFMDWGLPKDLLVPFKEQKDRMVEDESYIVRLYLDQITERIVASSKLNKFIEKNPEELSVDEEVNLFIYAKNGLGFKAIVNNKYSGQLYKNEFFQKLKIGQKLKGFIKNISSESKISLRLNKQGESKLDPLSSQILEYLRDHKGVMNITSKSSPEIIEEIFRTSKRNFKIALGGLYKQHVILIDDDRITLVGNDKISK